MSKSRGTKATQGINGDAATLERWATNVPVSAALVGEPCPYPHHRATDWVTSTSQVICGVCHPPALEFDGIRRRGEELFDELALDARRRVIPTDRHVEDLAPRAQRLELEEQTVDLADVAPALRDLLPKATATLEDSAPAELEEAELELAADLDAALEVDP
jgi:hypothetical protein